MWGKCVQLMKISVEFIPGIENIFINGYETVYES